MCGRFSLTSSNSEVANSFSAFVEDDFPARFNIAPTQPILIIRAPESYRDKQSNTPPHDSQLARWGFIPAWTKQPETWPLTFNIRAETVLEKKSFRNALHYHRIIIPASGFYEWKKGTHKKSQPYFIQPNQQETHRELIGFAGLMETWSGADGSQIDTAAIFTHASKPPLSTIHHRSPVILQKNDRDRWLDCRNFRPADVMDILTKSVETDWKIDPISDKVNNASYMGADIQNPIEIPNHNDKTKTPTNNDQFNLF